MIVSLFSSGGGGTYDVKLGVALPTVDDTGLVYDGTSKEPTIGSYSTELMTVTYTAQTNAGTYQVHCSLNDPDHYAWLNTIQSTDQDIPWTIARATGAISVSPNTVEVGEEETKTVTVTTSESTTVSALSSDTSVATVSVSGNTVSITDGGSEGTATITVSAADSTNYTYGTATVSVVVQYLTIVTWGGGTDEQIAKMCAASDQGKLNLWDYWNVGDERTVSLSAMAATGVGESHVAQDIIMVIVNKRGYDITSGNDSAFIVQQKQCFLNERGYMNSSATSNGGWDSCARRTWCNNVYKNAIPNALVTIFKQVNVKTSNAGYPNAMLITSTDYFFLPAEKEVSNTISNGAQVENELSQWEYYQTTTNWIRCGAYKWWLRSPSKPYSMSDKTSFVYVTGNPSIGGGSANFSYGIGPAACIGTVNDGSVIIPKWSNGTDEAIVAAIASADAGNCNLADFWNVGDKRAVSLSAMSATGVGESHRAQTVYMVLVDSNNTNYPYVTATSGRTYCNFVVQQENCLASQDAGTTSDSEMGYINPTNTSSGSWDNCARRTWCNNVYKNAIPSTFRSIFKQIKVTTATEYNASTVTQSNDYFFLPAAAELFKGDSDYGTGGTAGKATAYSNLTEFNALSRWKYYETASNRIKTIGLSGATMSWWTRSPQYISNGFGCVAGNDAKAYNTYMSSSNGIAPCGCI